MRKGTFFELGSAQCCHHLGYEKCYFVGKGYICVFTSLLNAAITWIRGVWSSLSCKRTAVFFQSVQYTKVAEVLEINMRFN